jgi:hypothetical protein
MHRIRISLASAAELKPDREQFEILVSRKNKQWISKGIFLELVIWEDLTAAYSERGLQGEYNRELRDCDLFVLLFYSRLGPYTGIEFDTALASFLQSGKPRIYLYGREPDASSGIKPDESVQAFRLKLQVLGNFPKAYHTAEELLRLFTHELELLEQTGKLFQSETPERNVAAEQPVSDLGKVHALLQDAFTPPELEEFTLLHFDSVYRQFTPAMPQGQRIQLLLTHARNHGFMSLLLTRVKAHNPFQYDRHAPYHP